MAGWTGDAFTTLANGAWLTVDGRITLMNVKASPLGDDASAGQGPVCSSAAVSGRSPMRSTTPLSSSVMSWLPSRMPM